MNSNQEANVDLRRIVNQREAAKLRSISVATLRREILRTGWPPVVRLSAGRIGHRICDVLTEAPTESSRIPPQPRRKSRSTRRKPDERARRAKAALLE